MLNGFLDGASRNDVAAHEILADARSSQRGPASASTAYSAEDIRIQQYDDTAVLTFRLVATTSNVDEAVGTHFLNTGTFVKRGGEWRAVAWQSTRVPVPQ